MPQTIYHRSHSDIISKKISPAPQGTGIIGTKSLLSADKRDFVSCKEAAKKMPAKVMKQTRTRKRLAVNKSA